MSCVGTSTRAPWDDGAATRSHVAHDMRSPLLDGSMTVVGSFFQFELDVPPQPLL